VLGVSGGCIGKNPSPTSDRPQIQHGIRACRIQGLPKPIHAQSPKSAGRERGVYWEKPKSHIR